MNPNGKMGDVATGIATRLASLLVLVIVCAIAARYAYFLSHLEQEPMSLSGSFIYLGIPYLAAFMFLAASPNRAGVARGSGIAFGVSAVVLMTAPVAYLFLRLAVWDIPRIRPNAVAASHVFPFFVAASLCLGYVSWKQGSSNRAAFAAGCISVLIYYLAIFLLVPPLTRLLTGG